MDVIWVKTIDEIAVHHGAMYAEKLRLPNDMVSICRNRYVKLRVVVTLLMLREKN